MMPVYNSELYHFGIKGMHWGHHKIQQIQKANKELFTREQITKTGVRAVNTAIMLSPLLKLGLGTMAKEHNRKRREAEAAVARWGANILTDKVSDYSHIIPNVSYTVR